MRKGGFEKLTRRGCIEGWMRQRKTGSTTAMEFMLIPFAEQEQRQMGNTRGEP